jgi:hypothetical protein
MTFCLGDSRAALDYDYRYKTARLSQTVADTVTNNSGCRRHAGRRRLRVCLVVLKLPVVEIHRQLCYRRFRLPWAQAAPPMAVWTAPKFTVQVRL